MTRSATLPTNVLTAAQLDAYRAVLAVKIQTASATWVRLCQGDVALSIDWAGSGAESYTPTPLSVSTISLSGVPGVVVRVYNTDGLISLADEAAPFVENVRTLAVLEIHWSAAGVQLTPVTLFNGHVLGVRYNGTSAELVGGIRAATAVGQVGRICSRLCNYTFKDANCAYAGADTSCLKTLAACTAKSNQARYGGFPTMPSRGTKIQYTLVKSVPYTTRIGATGYPGQAWGPGYGVTSSPGSATIAPNTVGGGGGDTTPMDPIPPTAIS